MSTLIFLTFVKRIGRNYWVFIRKVDPKKKNWMRGIKGLSGNNCNNMALIFGPDLSGMIEPNRKRSTSYVEDLAIE